jgi:hypothetical protein
MQGIYTHIPATDTVPKQYNVAAILSLLFMVPISLAAALALMYFYISTFRSMCAVPIWQFSVVPGSWFPTMMLTYFRNDFEMVPAAPIIIIIIIIIIITISFMQGIYTYISETNHVPKQYNVAAILSLLFMVSEVDTGLLLYVDLLLQ